MGYLDNKGLERYSWLVRNKLAKNDQMTRTVGAATLFPAPETELEPIVDFIFTETPPAEGEKSPSNPSTITGVAQATVTRCGKNLVKTPFYTSSTTTVHGVTFTIDNNAGTITVNGRADQDNDARIYFVGGSGKPRLVGGKSYCFSGCPSGGSTDTYYMGASMYTVVGGAYIRGLGSDTGSGNYWSITEDCTFSANITIKAGTEVSNLVFRPQVEEGLTVTAFEPYIGNDYTISLGDTYYGGSVNFKTGEMIVAWQGEQLNQFIDINAIYSSTIACVYNTLNGHEGNISNIQNFMACDKFPPLNGSGDVEHCRFTGATGISRIGTNFYISKSRLDVSGAADPSSPTNAEWLAAANAWLASNPIFVCYRLFTPQTVQLTPVQIFSLAQSDKYVPQINTVYSDQQSVRIGFERDDVVHRHGNEVIYGQKTFLSNSVTMSHTTTGAGYIIKQNNIERGVTWMNQRGRFAFTDKNNNYISSICNYTFTSGSAKNNQLQFILYSPNDTTASYYILFDAPSWTTFNFSPSAGADNIISLGTSGSRWKQLYAGTTTISTSDARCKDSVSDLPDAVLDVWANVRWRQFRFADAVEEKGESARLHSGAIAQEMQKAFSDAGLDVSQYGFFCHDSWDAKPEELDENGQIVSEARPAGDRYSLRYEEALCMEAAYLRRENARLKARLDALEERLAVLEMK